MRGFYRLELLLSGILIMVFGAFWNGKNIKAPVYACGDEHGVVFINSAVNWDFYERNAWAVNER